jgi:hypothetical protein
VKKLYGNLSSLKQNSLVRSIYFRLPITIRRYIRKNLNQRFVNFDIKPEEYRFDINEISTRIFTQTDLERVVNFGNLDWKAPQIFRKKATYACQEESFLDCDHITFDVWDTLIGRFRPAEGVKRATALYISLLDWKNRGFLSQKIKPTEIHEQRNFIESEQVERNGEATFSETLKELVDFFNLKIEVPIIYQYEIQSEIDNTYPISETTQILDNTRSAATFISDFHLPSMELSRILLAKGIDMEGRRVHTSADHGTTKRKNGDLFLALKYNELTNWIHVGDHDVSDVKNSTLHGARALKVTKESANSWHGHAMSENQLTNELYSFLSDEPNDSYLIDMSVIAYSLCTSAIERAWEIGASKVIYLSREGETLKLAHEEIIKNPIFRDFPNVSALHFPVSRSSIVMASWSGREEEGLSEISLQYPTMTPDAFVKTLGIPEDIQKLVFKNFGRLEVIRTNKIWSRIDSNTRNVITDYLAEQKYFIQRFIQENGFDPFKSVVCDLGWRGSIQDAMSRIIETHYSGEYLGLYSPFGAKGKGIKNGILFDQPKGKNAPEFFTFHGPIERAFTISNSPVLRYEEKEGRIRPVISKNISEQNMERSRFTKKYFPETVKEIGNALISIGILGQNSHPFCSSSLKNWMLNPSMYHASSWFDENHEEGFGAGDRVHYSKDLPSTESIGKPLQSVIKKKAVNSLWIEGFLAWGPVHSLIGQGEENHV